MDISRCARKILIGLVLVVFSVFGVGVARASETVGTIDSTFKYAWSNQIGWINFGATNGSVSITDSGITGYAWSPYFGWINFAPAGSGVTNAGGLGVLGGHAWGQNTGYISFTGVTINSAGQFTGTATGTIVGTLTFDCTNCSVKTDWRPVGSRSTGASTASVSVGGGGSVGGGFGFSAPAIPPPQVPSVTIPSVAIPLIVEPASVVTVAPPSVVPVRAVQTTAVSPEVVPVVGIEQVPGPQVIGETVPDAPCTEAPTASNSSLLQTGIGQAGVLTEGLIGDKVLTLTAPCTGAELVYAVSERPLAIENVPAVEAQIVGGFIYEITATDAGGSLARSFAKEIKITITIPGWVPQSGNEGVYYLDEGTNQWIGIPTAVFGDGFVEFTVDHLTKFAIIRTESRPTIIPAIRAGSGNSMEIDSKLRSQSVVSAEELFVESRFNNTGSEAIAVGFEAEILGPDGSVKAQIAEELVVVRQQSQSRQFAGVELSPGAYTLKTTVRFKDGTRKTFEESFVVRGSETNSFMIAGVSLGLFLLILVGWLLARKKSAGVPLA